MSEVNDSMNSYIVAPKNRLRNVGRSLIHNSKLDESFLPEIHDNNKSLIIKWSNWISLYCIW